MKSPILSRRGAVLVISMLPFFACAPMRMAVPGDLGARAKPMEVKRVHSFWIFGLKQLKFGPFATTDIKRGWKTSGGLQLGGYSQGDSRQSYSFLLKTDDAGLWYCECHASAARKSMSANLGGGTLSLDLQNKSALSCALKAPDGGKVWALDMESNPEPMQSKTLFQGSLKAGGAELKVAEHDIMEGVLHTATAPGYAFNRDGSSLGAVEVLNDGRVWIDPASGDARAPMAAAATALLLYQDLRQDLDKDD